MTQAQLTALKNDIAADPVLSAKPQNSDGDLAIAQAYNLLASPDYWVWASTVVLADIIKDPGFDWTRVDNLSVGKARIWEWLFQLGSINAGVANVRTAIDTVWVGTQADLSVRAVVYAACRRKATRAEKLFKTAGTGTTADPALMGFEGVITGQDVNTARNS